MRRLIDATGPLPWHLVPGLTGELHERTAEGRLDIAIVTDAPPGLPGDPRLEHHFLGTDEMVVVVPAGHRLAGSGPVQIAALAGETWAEDNEGSAVLLRQHAARAGVVARIDLHAADLHGKVALVATGHAIALVPGVLAATLRADVTTSALVDPPTRGIFAVLPHRDAHPVAPLLVRQIMRALSVSMPRSRRPSRGRRGR
jgi:DNA-binding transcriptional LysR family regulator